MRKVVRMALALAGATLLMAVGASAQVQTGSVSIKAFDDQGAVMPGANVTITGPVLPRAIEGTTDAGGVFQVPGLAPGAYNVKVSLQGFQSLIRENVIVRQGQTASLDAQMKLGSVTEAVTVKGESPVVDTKTVGSRTNIDSALLETTPGGKDIWNILEYKAPGVVVETPDVGGNQGGLQRSMSARGTPNSQNTQMLNGVNVNDPAAQGFSMNYYIPSAFENIQVSTGAQDIAVGTGGVFINMVTKSGTNQFRGEALQTYQGKRTQSNNIDRALLNAGFRPDANSTELISNSNVQAGGPLFNTNSGRPIASRGICPNSATTSRTAVRASPTRRTQTPRSSTRSSSASSPTIACSAPACFSTQRSATTIPISRCTRRRTCSR